MVLSDSIGHRSIFAERHYGVESPGVHATPQRAPAGLETAGKRLWKAVTTEFHCRPDELLVLEAAARLADEIARLEAELKAGPTMILGSMGQKRPNGLFAEVRNHRLAQGRLLAQLGLEDAPGDRSMAKSNAGRRMARIRWSGG